MIENILILIIGWLLGLLAPAIVDTIRDKREAKVIKDAIFTELRELEYRLMLVVYRIESKYGALNQEFFKWAQSILVEYDGINSIDSLLKTIGPILKLTDEEMDNFAKYARQESQPNSGLALKKHSLALLDSNLVLLSKFHPILLGQLLEIKTHIGFINEIIEDARYYFRLSFQDNISPLNSQIADRNMIDSYKTYASQARVVIDIIRKTLPKKVSS
jgi:hypothetical protein